MAVLKPRLDELIEYCHKLGLLYIDCPSPMRRDPAAKAVRPGRKAVADRRTSSIVRSSNRAKRRSR